METKLNLGDIVEAEITKITNFGAFVKVNRQNSGLIHISQISNSFVKDVNRHLKVGDKVKARVIKLGPDNKIDLSLKVKKEEGAFHSRQKGRPFGPAQQKNNSGFKSSDFEEKLRKFLQQSRQTLADLKRYDEKHRK